jgi:alpha-galactosidase
VSEVDAVPFSFRYGGVASAELLADWPATMTEHRDADRSRRTVTWSGPDGLRISWVLDRYRAHPVTEWTVHVRNDGSGPSGRLTDVLALDTTIAGPDGAAGLPTVRTGNGSVSTAADFAPYSVALADRLLLFPTGGKSTSGVVSGHPVAVGGGWPYVNLDWGPAGVVVALGWPGQWALEIAAADGPATRLRGGMANTDAPAGDAPDITDMALTDLWLRPGEEFRTPLVIVADWRGEDWIDGQNAWRDWFLRHNTPRPHGAAPAPMCPTGSVCGSYNFTLDTTGHELEFLRRYRDHGLTPAAGGAMDWWWIDAGWYRLPAHVDPTDRMAWTHTGTWEPDLDRYPRGLKEVTDAARAEGMRAIVWHEPERCRPGTWLPETHPEWLLAGSDEDHLYVDLGNPEALGWVVETFDALIGSNGADLYRQDFNYHGPLPYWNRSDEPGRRGAVQIHYIQGLLRFWDELRTRHPDMLIDNCASGGRRLDPESLRRAVVMSQSDDVRDPEGSQSQFLGLSPWVVCHGTSARTDSLYALRSSMNWLFEVHLDGVDTELADEERWQLLRTATEEWRQVADSYLGRFYPLTPYSRADTEWVSYQYDRPDLDRGVVHGFARARAEAATTVRVRGLDPALDYELTDLDSGARRLVGGGELAAGLRLEAAERPYAVILAYRAAGRP